MKLVTIKSSHFPSELTVLKSRLEAEGIQCFLEGALTSQVLSHIPSTEAELKVKDVDLEKVRQILIETGALKTEDQTVVCPKCGAEKIIARKNVKESLRLIKAVLLTLVTFKPVNHSYRAKDYVCENCGHEFSVKE